ncbi:MAG TPA: tetratricopeptide repeat protein [Phenylobacterium sp.]|uniref:tetratricopeptide repeat protein n=1 Tax=Phenylobacterium sp. TaxID=1871053 RepID=UPI002CB1EA5C|nr:tetratricopeptide repeat protein [Phenylobacterium sp.]HSV02899.1 tetratricopeptide repeat protein [Phenylobacterium sp.]
MKDHLAARAACGAAMLIAACLSGPPSAQAGLFSRHSAKAAAVPKDYIAEIQRAIDEQRLYDAGQLLDQALLTGHDDPHLRLMGGRLALARGRLDDALSDFKRVDQDPALKGDALEGEGISLSLLGRSDEAVAVLRQAVAVKPSAWRAWNALGSEYDSRRRWPESDAAYERALSESDRAPIALNNRGYSRMLQGRLEEAIKDFVEALGKKPGMAAARNNLRLAMAMSGEYDRALAGAPQTDEAATLNNAGFAAIMRGDYQAAEDLLQRAMSAKGEYYARAATNLQLARTLEARATAAPKPAAKQEP